MDPDCAGNDVAAEAITKRADAMEAFFKRAADIVAREPQFGPCNFELCEQCYLACGGQW